MADDEDLDYQDELRRIRELEEWFEERGYVLLFDVDVDEDGFGGFEAQVMSADFRLSEVVAPGTGSRQIDAAERAREDFLDTPGWGPAQRVEIGQAQEVDEALPLTPVIVSGGGESEAAVGAPTVRQVPPDVRERLEGLLMEFGWRIGFHIEPDGGFSWIVAPLDSNKVIQSGLADTWDDALLETISNLHPPSEEGRA